MASDDYKWDGASKDERESEFASSSFSTTAGVFHSTLSHERRRVKRSPLAAIWRPIVIAVAVSAVALYFFVAHFRA